MSTAPKHDEHRQTGRTSRQLVLAMCNMLMGKRVLYVSHNIKASTQHRHWCTEWLRTNGWYDQQVVPLHAVGDTLQFGSGSLTFRPMTSNLAGLRFTLTIEDHHAEELRKEQERKAEFIADQQTIFTLMRKHGMFCVSLGREKRNGP